MPTTTAEGKLCEMHAQQGVSLTQKGPVYWPTAGELSLTLLGGVVFCSSSYLGSHAEMTGSPRESDTSTGRISRVPASMKAITSYKVQRQNKVYLKEVYWQNIASVHACSAFML